MMALEREEAANDDDETHDSRVRVTIHEDGEYFIRVTDKRKQGGPGFIYRVYLCDPSEAGAAFVLLLPAAPVAANMTA